MILLNILLGLIFMTLIVMSAAGNFLVCLAIFFDRKLRRQRENLFLISLAVSDLLVAVLVMIFAASNDLLRFWPFGQVYCTMWMYFDVTLCTASILNMSAIAVDRYAHISNPLKYQEWVRRSRICWVIVLLWFISALTGSIQLIATKVLPNQNVSLITSPVPMSRSPPVIIIPGDHHHHERPPPRCDLEFSVFTGVVSSSLSFFIPASFMLFAYYKLYRCARRHLRSIRGQIRAVTESLIAQSKRLSCPAATKIEAEENTSTLASEQKARLTLGVIMGIFLICWLPFFIVNVIRVLYPDLIPPWLFACVTWLGYANSTANPIIYSIFNRDFRNAFRNILKMICGSTKLSKSDFETSFSPFRENSKLTNHNNHKQNHISGSGPNLSGRIFSTERNRWREYNSMSNLERQASYGTLMGTQTVAANDQMTAPNHLLLHPNDAVSISNNHQSTETGFKTQHSNSIVRPITKRPSGESQTESIQNLHPNPKPIFPPRFATTISKTKTTTTFLNNDVTVRSPSVLAIEQTYSLSQKPPKLSQSFYYHPIHSSKGIKAKMAKTCSTNSSFKSNFLPTILRKNSNRNKLQEKKKESRLPRLILPLSLTQEDYLNLEKTTTKKKKKKKKETLQPFPMTKNKLIILSENQSKTMTTTMTTLRRSKSDNTIKPTIIIAGNSSSRVYDTFGIDQNNRTITYPTSGNAGSSTFGIAP